MASQLFEFLKNVPLFADLPEEDLEEICKHVEEVYLKAGEELFAEGDQGEQAYVVKSGEISIVKQARGQEVLLAVRGQGDVVGEMALLQQAPRMASVRARTEVALLAIGFDQLDKLLNRNPSAARTMLNTITSRLRATLTLLRQSEKMAQLGNLAAGMAHELNNPAAAAQRGVEVVRASIEKLQAIHVQLDALGLSEAQLERLVRLNEEIRDLSNSPTEMDALTRSDQEEALEEWLDGRGVKDSWEMAPNLVQLGFDGGRLGPLADEFSAEQLPTVMAWMNESYSVYSVIAEVAEGATRISEIVNALKSYSYLDQAPVQDVDVHKGLDNTLILLRNKLKKGVTVVRNYGEDLPHITAYGSELNQVWTNIIDNAIYAMDGLGELTITTCKAGDWVEVEICDSGAGIPQDIQERIFDPYFTTKPPGKGTGLGLDISRKIVTDKHQGKISVKSEPGRTCFTVQLPTNPEVQHA